MCTELWFPRDKTLIEDTQSLAKRLGMTVLPMCDHYCSTPELMGGGEGAGAHETMCLCPVDINALAATWRWKLDRETEAPWVTVHEPTT